VEEQDPILRAGTVSVRLTETDWTTDFTTVHELAQLLGG
jgi:hypothetical protein